MTDLNNSISIQDKNPDEVEKVLDQLLKDLTSGPMEPAPSATGPKGPQQRED